MSSQDGLEGLLGRLLAERYKLDKDIEAVQRTIKLREGVIIASKQAGKSSDKRYSKMKIPDALKDFLKENAGKEYKTSQIAQELKNRGIHTKARQFSSNVHKALERLCKNNSNLSKRKKRNPRGTPRERKGIWVFQWTITE